MAGPLFLGIDSSTQALKASLLDEDLKVLSEVEVRFDADLPHFKTHGGVLHGPEGSSEVFSPVMQPIEALDILLDRMKAAKWPVGRIKAVSAAGQVRYSLGAADTSNMPPCTGRRTRRASSPRLTLASRWRPS